MIYLLKGIQASYLGHNARLLMIFRGHPGFFFPHLYLYLQKPVPVLTGMGFPYYG